MSIDKQRIMLNRIRTPDGTILTSRHRHDYVIHTDSNGLDYVVDGGLDYCKRSINSGYQELSVWDNDPWDIVRVSFCRGVLVDKATHYRPICSLTNSHIQNIITYNIEKSIDAYQDIYLKELEYRELNDILLCESVVDDVGVDYDI